MVFHIIFFNCRHYHKGTSDGYRCDMSRELIKRFDDWMAEKLKDSEFKFIK